MAMFFHDCAVLNAKSGVTFVENKTVFSPNYAARF